MNGERVRIDRSTWTRLRGSIRNLAISEVGWKAKAMFGGLIAFLLAINGLNVLASYVGRDFMTAIADRQMAGFLRLGLLYIAVFAASTVAAVLYRFTEERLGILWREWLTRRLVRLYLDQRIYYHLQAGGEIANPDQRISEDVRAYTATTLSFALMLLNGGFTVFAFSGVLWSISAWLLLAAVVYAACGSYFTVRLGRRLIRLNYDQSDREANFRAELLHVRENAESVALLRSEPPLENRLLGHLDALVGNFKRIIVVNRNLGFFTTGYNYLIQVIPVLIVAPLYIQGEAEFGVIAQATIAFAQLLGAFSLIVTQFQSISSYAAVVARLGDMGEAIEQVRARGGATVNGPVIVDLLRYAVEQVTSRGGAVSGGAFCDICAAPGGAGAEAPPGANLVRVEEEDSVRFESLTLRSPRDGRLLVDDLSLAVPEGLRLLIAGPNTAGKIALFRATAGIWELGEGRIVRPGVGRMRFLPERPYLPPGTLRELLQAKEPDVIEPTIREILSALDLDSVLLRAGGLDVAHDWEELLSFNEQQRLAIAQVLLANPRFVFLDRPGTALGREQTPRVLGLFSDLAITYLTLGDGEGPLEHYDELLEVREEGIWRRKCIRGGKIIDRGTVY